MTTMTESGVEVRLRSLDPWRLPQMLPRLMEIEQAGFEFPWNEEDFARMLMAGATLTMAEVGGRVVGFVVRMTHCRTIQLLNLAVAAGYRRWGIGRQLLEEVTKTCGMAGYQVTCEVRETNLTAQLFLRSHGFRATQILRRFYEDTPEDAYVMTYRAGRITRTCEGGR